MKRYHYCLMNRMLKGINAHALSAKEVKINKEVKLSEETVEKINKFKKGKRKSPTGEILKSIREVRREEYGYSGLCVYKDNKEYFEINIIEDKPYTIGLIQSGKKRCKYNSKRAVLTSVRYGHVNGTTISISTIIAYIELLLVGWYCNPYEIGVNHKDNSASKEAEGLIENLDPSNLELYKLQSSENRLHGLVWNKVKKITGANISFSCYDIELRNKIDNLIYEGKMNTEQLNVMCEYIAENNNHRVVVL